MSVHVVWAVRYPGPCFHPITPAIPREQAVRVVFSEWSSGVMARLKPPLRPDHVEAKHT